MAPLSPPADIHANRALVVRSLSMSERLVIPGRAEAESELSVAHPWWQFSVRFNVAVSHNVPVVRMHERETEGVMMRWGLVPSSAKGDVTRGGHAHARSDALQSAEDFRSAWFHGRRDIVPLAGFYIWQRTPAGYRQPYYVRRSQPSRVWSCGALGALDNRG